MQTVSNKTDKPLAQPQLIERGWTQTLIKKFLPEPILKQNPCFASAAPMKLWNIREIEEVEQRTDFQAELVKANRAFSIYPKEMYENSNHSN